MRFRGDRRVCYRANVWLRTAIRVQQQLAVTGVRSEQQLYEFVRNQPWEDYVRSNGTLIVDASLRDSFLTHSRYAEQLVKDAVCDRFRDATGERPSVDRDEADLPIRLLLQRDRATLYIDRSGDSLHKRGYRPIQVKSPLNEAIAAGLLLASDWDRKSPLVDPMCGSATFCIEAAHIAGDRAPGLERSFALEFQEDFDGPLWREVLGEAQERAEKGAANIPPIAGADVHPGAISVARRAVGAAGVEGKVQLFQSDVADWTPPFDPDVIVVNPPYGERIGEGDGLEASWRGLAQFLRARRRCVAWVLSGNAELTRFLSLRASGKVPVRNGPIDCRWLRYEVGRREDASSPADS